MGDRCLWEATAMPDSLSDGLYELVVTDSLRQRITHSSDAFAELQDISPDTLDRALTAHVSQQILARLGGAESPAAKVAIVNQVLADLASPEADPVPTPPQELLSVHRDQTRVGGLPRTHGRLGETNLLTNAAGDAAINVEVGAELRTADAVDLVCAFIRWTGIRTLLPGLSEARDRGIPIRILTTTYTGTTERAALDRLVREFGADIRISYETQSTRLHAKAWLFRRETGFGTAYVGSSNLTKAAMVDGLEWNVRVSEARDPQVLEKFQTTYESYWSSGSFIPYNPDTDAATLDEALRLAGGAFGGAQLLSGLDVTPRPHQVRILEELSHEREANGHHRNLVVAATGTGKTVVAGLDYKRLRTAHGELRLLFVAHRREILEQARRTFREILRDPDFGELMVGGLQPVRNDHVFASIQSLRQERLTSMSASQFDVVIVDEFHHAEAKSYQRLLTHLVPRELLGLTATPERADGVNVSKFFDGRVASELRLWDALHEDLLVPFHYFGVADNVDLTGVEWSRQGYDAQGLENVYTGNDARADVVIGELRDKTVDISRIRALGFCVSVAHAEYMARYFNEKGIPSIALHGKTPVADREDAGRKLIDRSISCIFTVDLFNEGIDIPEIDTVLFLRPTQSATVFLQQLGRGLRRSEGKSVLTVLDFVGMQNANFRFDLKLRALTGSGRRDLQQQIEYDFPFLPSGCHISLDRVSKDIVLENVRRQITMTRKQLVADIRSHNELKLADYIRESGRDVTDIYKKASWTDLAFEAGLAINYSPATDKELLKRARAFIHVDDPERAAAYSRLISPLCGDYDALTPRDQAYARMLGFTVWPSLGNTFGSFQQALMTLRANDAFCSELKDVLALGAATSRIFPQPLTARLATTPLFSHATYKREEVLAAMNWASLGRAVQGAVTGVMWCEDFLTDIFFVNLHKTDSHFSDTTMYKDYALGTQLFHWESQSSTSPDSVTGRRYIEHRATGTNIVLFTRDAPEDEVGAGAPFRCLGQVDYVSHNGSKPIAFTWKLRRDMPSDVYQSAAAVVV
jgi:superfamily II DNA or RNA helicase/HKD family nuclease